MITTSTQRLPLLRRIPWLGASALVAAVVTLYLSLVWSPPDAVQGDVARILYVHVPAAWLAYLAFVVVFLASVAWLWSRKPVYDAIAVASAEIGVLFTGLVLVVGSIYAKPTWGVWWTWEPRLLTTAGMFAMYLGYLLVRGLSTDFERRATRAAVLGIVFVVDIPIVHLSVLWMNSLHQLPTVLRAGGGPAMESRMLFTLLVANLAGALVYGWLLARRVRIELDRQARLLAARS
ncbi:MAG: cytochrome C biogenesis protein [Chloroflexi bacterium]|nr:cytochrome C biogenesis protein [Chloroflexota bacterium]